jgi:hypothetical protein
VLTPTLKSPIWIRDYNPPRCFQNKISSRSKHNATKGDGVPLEDLLPHCPGYNVATQRQRDIDESRRLFNLLIFFYLQRQGPRKKCSACKIIVHSGCMAQLERVSRDSCFIFYPSAVVKNVKMIFWVKSSSCLVVNLFYQRGIWIWIPK